MTKPEALFTGGCGYLGAVMAPLFARRGFNVTVVDPLMYGQTHVLGALQTHDNLWYETAPLERSCAWDVVEQFDVIVHLAALVGAPACHANPDLSKEINVDLTRKLISQLRPTQQILFATTNSAYGSNPGISTEESPCRPISEYGVHKHEAESIVLQHPNSTVFRLATVFGLSPRMRFDLLVNRFILDAVRNKCIRVFGGHLRRNFVHIQDVCEAFFYATHSSQIVPQNVWNLGCDAENGSKDQLARRIYNNLSSELQQECTIEQIPDVPDPDERDYEVSSEKLVNAGFVAMRDLDESVFDIEHYCKNLRGSLPEHMFNA